MTLNGMSSDPHNGVNSLDLILMRLVCVIHLYKYMYLPSGLFHPYQLDFIRSICIKLSFFIFDTVYSPPRLFCSFCAS